MKIFFKIEPLRNLYGETTLTLNVEFQRQTCIIDGDADDNNTVTTTWLSDAEPSGDANK